MIELCDIPMPAGWRRMQPAPHGDQRAHVTMPAPWEFAGCDDDPAWPGLFMEALAIEFELCDLDITYLDQIENPWATIPNTLFRAAQRAREWMKHLAASGRRSDAA